MKRYHQGWRRALHAASFGIAVAATGTARAGSDEIQVYADDLNKPGERGIELHVNYAPVSRKNPDYPGERAPYRILRVTPEISTGIAPDWDAGIYLPGAWSAVTGSSFFDGPKLRLKYLRFAESGYGNAFYGANLEIAYSSARVSAARWGSELRFIAGIDTENWLFAVNPILARPLSSPIDASGRTTEFNLSVKAVRKVRDGLAIGVEHYAETGELRHIRFDSSSGQTTYLVADFERKGYDLNVGVGHGWTPGTDKLIFKMVFGIPF